MGNEDAVKMMLKRRDAKVEQRQEWEPFYSSIARYIRPRKKSIDSFSSPGQLSNDHYDSTAPAASNTLALIMADTLTPKAIEWFGFSIPESSPFSRLNKNVNVKNWLRELNVAVFAGLAQSNFYSVINEIYADFNSFATVCLYLEESRLKKPGFNGFNFRALPISSYVFAEDDHGLVDTVFRDYDFTVRQLFQRFDKAKIPGKYAKKLEKSPDDPVKMVSCVCPSRDIPKSLQSKMPFTSLDMLEEDKVVLETMAYNEFPYMVGRWDKASGEDRGRGPAAVAMADILSLNELRRQELIGLQKAVNPPILSGEEGFVGTVQMIPNAIVYSRNPREVRTMPSELRLNLSSLVADNLMRGIKDMYLVDQLNLPRGKAMTAEEVITVRGEVERLLGPTVSRFESEVLGPMLERCAAIMVRTKAISEPPSELDGLDTLDIVYTGQLARAQKLAQVQAIQRWSQMNVEFSSADPGVLDVQNLQEASRFAAPLMGVPPEVVRSKADTEKIQAEKAQAAQAEKEGQQQQEGMDSISKTAPLLKVLGEQGGGILGGTQSQIPAGVA
tara:strand:- start:1132 stop:2802 length:1671 start_codon:yes stop_codon:yes gene_type:complete